ncbi:hypothetical protein AGR8A_pTi20160 [Agrobacterium fabrum str. J-07]|nr:hypothetical protein AGR8A_pTi20160 [Agrobacterium fabrum str. J-07]
MRNRRSCRDAEARSSRHRPSPARPRPEEFASTVPFEFLRLFGFNTLFYISPLNRTELRGPYSSVTAIATAFAPICAVVHSIAPKYAGCRFMEMGACLE